MDIRTVISDHEGAGDVFVKRPYWIALGREHQLGLLGFFHDDVYNLTKTYTYDNQDRISTIAYSGAFSATVTYTYDDAAGTNTGVPNALWKEKLTYNNEIYRRTYIYDSSGKISSVIEAWLEMKEGYLIFYGEGQAVDEEVIFDGFYPDEDLTVNKVTLIARTPPVGANLTLDLLRDGTEQLVISTLTDGSTYETTDISDTAFTTAQRLGGKIKSVGSTTPGEGLSVILHYSVTG